jgi:hypothetical protein
MKRTIAKKNTRLRAVTPRVTEGLIKLIKLQLSPNTRLNQDTKVWKKNIRFRSVTLCITEGLIKSIKLQLSHNTRLNQDTKV